jgi:signal peptidase II
MTAPTDIAPAAPRAARTLSRLTVAILALVVMGVDQATKLLVVRGIPEHEVIPLIPGLLNLTHTTNTGVAFGMFSESPAAWKTALLTVVSLALLGIVIAMVGRAKSLALPAGLGLALILGGALSNLADRVRAGVVVDFLDAYVRTFHWYTFNVADAAIVVGAGVLVVHLLRSE